MSKDLFTRKRIKISELSFNTGQVPGLPKNPRFIRDQKFEAMCQSIREDPEYLEVREVLIYDYQGVNVVIAGEMRTRGAKHEGHKDVPCKVFPESTPIEKIRAYAIKDNAHYGEWDQDSLANDWEAGELKEWGVDEASWGEGDNSLNGAKAEEDDYNVPEIETIKTDIVLGDLFEIGEHRLLCGDSTLNETFERLMDGKFADMCVTDPPYNVAYKGKTKDALTIENDSMGDADFYKFLYNFYAALATSVKKGGAIYVWHSSSEVINFARAMVDAGWLLKQQIIWVKNAMVMGRQDYQWKHEPCLYGWLAGDSHKWYSDRKQTTVIEWDKPQRSGEHPTMKPIGLFAYQIENSSKVGDIIIDAFGGSGTTMVACQQLKRKANIIEYDPKYCDVIVRRMMKLDPELTVKRNGVDETNKWTQESN